MPGWGQLAWRRNSPAFTFFFISALLVVGIAWAVVIAVLEPLRFAAWAVQREVWLALIGVNVAAGLFRAVSVVDAHAGAGGRILSAGLISALVFVAVPHAGIGWLQVRSYQAMTAVFQPQPSQGPLAQGPSTTTTTTTTQPTTTSSSPSVTLPGETTTTQPTTTTTVGPFGDRLTVLLLGSDAGPRRSGVRTDTVMVVTIDVSDGDLAIFGLPRNLSGLVYPDGLRVSGILNTVYTFGVQRPDRFPGIDSGATAVAELATEITGIGIDYFVMVDMLSFVDIVDALGGVTMYVPEAVYDEQYETDPSQPPGIYFPVGYHDFDGSDALAYVRTRRYSSDYSRMARQRCVIAAMADQLDPGKLLRGLPTLIATFEENVDTDIPFSLVPDLIRLLDVVDMDDAVSVGFSPPDWTRSGNVPDIPKIREAVALAIEDPAAALEMFELERTTSSCGPA